MALAAVFREFLLAHSAQLSHYGALTHPRDAMADESRSVDATLGDPTVTDEGKYVYCIIKSEDTRDFGPIGIGGEANPVYTVHFKDLAAVVSDTPIRIYDPTRENVLAHELVNETVMREFTVIPMSFGTIFRTKDDIVELLKSTYRAFDDVLEKMKDKIEFGLKVLWDRDRVVARLEDEDEEIHRLKQEITSNEQSSTYFARMQLGRLVESGLEEAANTYVMDIHQSLKPFAIASRSNKPIGDRMILNGAYLVERQREAEFDEAVKELSRKYEDILSFKYTGPWPPSNFVNIKLKLERADA
jgi:Mg2+ and Co2+ transporter CorA